MKKQVLITLASALVLASGVARADLVVNGGFETGDFTGWNVNANFTGVSGAGGPGGYNPHSGNFYAFLGNVGCCGFLSQTLATNPGTSYRISLFLNSNGTTPNEFDVEWNGATLFDQIDIPNTGGYEQLTFTAVETGSDTLTLSERNDPDYLALDDVSVTAPEPASLTLLGVALLGFGVLRRRSRRA